MESVFQGFLESQQANALSVQSVPSLLSFTGEDVEAEAKRWLDRFEERATMLSWTDELKCYHIKQYLAGTALQVLPPAKHSNYGQLIEALKDRFKPIDIEGFGVSSAYTEKSVSREVWFGVNDTRQESSRDDRAR